jgi:hypothetical protein
MKNIFFAAAAMLLGYTASAQQVTRMVNDYITVKNALVNGDSKTAAQAAAAFQQSVKDEAAFSQKEQLLNAADELAKANSLEKQRAVFNEVSTSLWKTVKSAEKPEAPLYYQYCPMKKSYWVSKEKEVKNPYYGSAMLTCGKVVETN